ncbi:MAG: 30S ribosomal protein S8 [Pseudomonadota bacterium]
MSLQDPIADFLTRIRNGQVAAKKSVTMPSSKQKIAVAKVLKEEGYIIDYAVDQAEKKPILTIELKYYRGKGVIEQLKRISRSGLRIYKKHDELPEVMGGLGIAVVSTSKGVMTGRAACAAGVGGEIICTVA